MDLLARCLEKVPKNIIPHGVFMVMNPYESMVQTFGVFIVFFQRLRPPVVLLKLPNGWLRYPMALVIVLLTWWGLVQLSNEENIVICCT